VNDDRQHEDSLGMDITPLYFGIAGLPGTLAPAARGEILQLLIAAPQLDPNAGLSLPTADGFIRRSPLLAALETLVQRSSTAAARSGEHHRARWRDAGEVVSALVQVRAATECWTQSAEHRVLNTAAISAPR
jgi:hypothetical protein